MRALLRPFRWLFRCSSGDPAAHPAAQAAAYTKGCAAEDCAVIVVRQDRDVFRVFGRLSVEQAARLAMTMLAHAAAEAAEDQAVTERVQ